MRKIDVYQKSVYSEYSFRIGHYFIKSLRNLEFQVFLIKKKLKTRFRILFFSIKEKKCFQVNNFKLFLKNILWDFNIKCA